MKLQGSVRNPGIYQENSSCNFRQGRWCSLRPLQGNVRTIVFGSSGGLANYLQKATYYTLNISPIFFKDLIIQKQVWKLYLKLGFFYTLKIGVGSLEKPGKSLEFELEK